MKKNILVTGGAGFIGSNLCRTLLKRGHAVWAADNLITGRIKNTEDLLRDKNFRFLKIDVNDKKIIPKLKAAKLAEIYHLACPTGVPNIKHLGEEMVLTCSIGTINVMELARKHGARVVFSSSAEIYGQPEKNPQEERYNGNVNPIGPRSAYEEGKRFSETVMRLYFEKYGVHAKIVRIFNTYGPGMRLEDQRVIPQFIRSAYLNESLVVYGDGGQTRTFLYIDDLVNGLMIVMEKGRAGEAYNIGGSDQITIKQLAKTFRRIMGAKNNIVFLPHFIEDHKRRQPSIKKIKKFGWRPKTALDDGLKKTIVANGL